VNRGRALTEFFCSATVVYNGIAMTERVKALEKSIADLTESELKSFA
jgi:hypothetical protein